MRLLLDTCTFLWLIIDDDSLTSRVKDLFVNPDNEVFFSVVSAWEIALKCAVGRLDLPDEPRLYIPEQRETHSIQSLLLDEASSLQVSSLPKVHDDPFDRMLISQALIHGLTILTPDELIKSTRYLNDFSAAFARKEARWTKRQLKILHSYDRDGMDEPARLSYDILDRIDEKGVKGKKREKLLMRLLREIERLIAMR